MKKPTQKELQEFLDLAPMAKRFEELKKYLKEYMESENENTFKNGNYELTLIVKTRNVFDQTLYKSENPKQYEKYKHPAEYKTVNVDKH